MAKRVLGLFFLFFLSFLLRLHFILYVVLCHALFALFGESRRYRNERWWGDTLYLLAT